RHRRRRSCPAHGHVRAGGLRWTPALHGGRQRPRRAMRGAWPPAGGMSSDDFMQQRAAQRGRNLLLQELRETCERARLGGFFYPVAALLAFAAAGIDAWRWQVAAVVGTLLVLAGLRCLVRPSA